MEQLSDFYEEDEKPIASDEVNIKKNILASLKGNKKLLQIVFFAGGVALCGIYLMISLNPKKDENKQETKRVSAGAIDANVYPASYKADSNGTIEEIQVENVPIISTQSIGAKNPNITAQSQTPETQRNINNTSYAGTQTQVGSSGANKGIPQEYINAINSPQVISGTKSNIDQNRANEQQAMYVPTQVPVQAQIPTQAQMPTMYGTAQQKQQPEMTYQLFPGSVIQAVLISSINSDLPGLILARVTRTIYDSKDGTKVLIPQGSIFIADYSSDISLQQNRLQVIWRRLVRPDGLIVDIQGYGTDKYGTAGVSAKVNRHILLKGLGIGMTFLYGVGVGIVGAVADQATEAGKTVVDTTAQPILQTSNAMINQTLNVPNTLNVKAGTVATIVIFDPLELPEYK